jgi:hypothetical protein
LEVDEDGLRFDAETVVAGRISEDADYEGVRVTFDAYLERAKIPIQIVVTPAPSETGYPTRRGIRMDICKVASLRPIQAFRYVFSLEVRIFLAARTGSLGDSFCGEKRFRATIMSCHSGLEPQPANKNFRNSFFAIPNQFALDELLEGADHLRGVPA